MSAIMTETEIESQDSSSDGSNYCHRDAGWPYYTALLITDNCRMNHAEPVQPHSDVLA